MWSPLSPERVDEPRAEIKNCCHRVVSTHMSGLLAQDDQDLSAGLQILLHKTLTVTTILHLKYTFAFDNCI